MAGQLGLGLLQLELARFDQADPQGITNTSHICGFLSLFDILIAIGVNLTSHRKSKGAASRFGYAPS